MKHSVKYSIKFPGQYLPWLLLLFLVDIFAALLLWLAAPAAFIALIFVMVLFSILLFSCVCIYLYQFERKKEQAFYDFLENPDEYHKEELLGMVSAMQGSHIRMLGERLWEMQHSYGELYERLEDYEEYAESWAHEIKTPLSLLSFMLDNRREELPEAVGFKLDFIRSRMQESVDQMLFYARLKGTKKDYLFEQIEILSCVQEVIEDYKPLLEEKGFEIQCFLSYETVYTDRRGIRFLLGQVISNAIKYCSSEPKLWFEFVQKENAYVLTVRDNGIGVRDCDVPYIFEKGFTGDSGENRKRATGMGLYLVQGIAKDLNLTLNVHTEWEKGFEIQISFPIVAKGDLS